MQKKYSAFTLVELIVVITILAVLSTVAFISFQGYTSSSRDSVRLADLKNITKSFELMRTKDIQLPLPDKSVNIASSGTIFQYQGVLEEKTLQLSNIHNGGFDPLTGDPYGYAVNAARNKFQLIGFLENNQAISSNLISQSLADNSDKYIKTSGDALGIILNPTTNEVVIDSSVSQIDISTNTDEYNVVVDKNNIQKTSEIQKTLVHRINTQASCNTILLNGLSQGDGIYSINPTGVDGQDFDVYCDMKTDGGGWTLLVGIDENSLAFGNNFIDQNQWFKTDLLGTLPNNDSEIYSSTDFKSPAYSQVFTKSVRLCYGDSSSCYSFNHDKNISLFDFFDKDISYHDAGYNKYGSYNYSYNESRLKKYTQNLGLSLSTYYNCQWLGINKLYSGDNRTNNGAIGLLQDNDGGCASDEQGLIGSYDNGAIGVGLNSCGDNSSRLETGGTTCQPGGTNSLAGNQRNVSGVNSVAGPWAVWGK